MNEAIEKIKEIGLEAVHHKTHVSIKSLEHIINERYDAIHYIHFNGFLNIIENELHIDMDPLRKSLKEHRINSGQNVDGRRLFVTTPGENESKKPLYIILSVIAAVVLAVFLITSEDEKKTQGYEDSVQSSAIEDAKLHLENKDATGVATFESDTADEKEIPAFTKPESRNAAKPLSAAAAKPLARADQAAGNHPFVVYPKESLWIGIINLDTDEQKDTITSEPYPLDETANLLITLGHGYLKIDLNGKIEDISERGRVRYLYKSGKLSRITANEFKDLNRGKAW